MIKVSFLIVLLLNCLFFFAACHSSQVKEDTPEYFLGKELVFNPQSKTAVDSLLKE